jgi:hypothetical protein
VVRHTIREERRHHNRGGNRGFHSLRRLCMRAKAKGQRHARLLQSATQGGRLRPGGIALRLKRLEARQLALS